MTDGFLGHEQEGLRHEEPARMLEHMTNDYPYETRIGEWVTARCRKRDRDHGKKMPQVVKTWLDEGGNSPADENTKPTLTVAAWLVATIEDPDWPDGWLG